jgi:hypothetical protein
VVAFERQNLVAPRGFKGATSRGMSQVKSIAAAAIVALLAACGQYDAYTEPAARAAALPGRFAPYVGPGNGWGGPTVSLYTPSAAAGR